MPLGDESGVIEGFQLWVNLPAADKMMQPRYQGVSDAEIPLITVAGGALVRIIAGEAGGVRGPVEGIVTDPEYLDVTIPQGMRFEHASVAGHTVFAYVIAGRACFAENPADTEESDCASDGTAVLFGDGDRLVAGPIGDEPTRFLLVSGRPLGEPIAWGGPIVMNTDEELRAAFQELEDGTFAETVRQD
jgi:redox-sensitive bicupin YhaK (pirin superfamily)